MFHRVLDIRATMMSPLENRVCHRVIYFAYLPAILYLVHRAAPTFSKTKVRFSRASGEQLRLTHSSRRPWVASLFQQSIHNVYIAILHSDRITSLDIFQPRFYRYSITINA